MVGKKKWESKTLTSLPQGLRDTIKAPVVGADGVRAASGANASLNKNGRKVRKSRKESRAQARQKKKQKRAKFYDNSPKRVEMREQQERKRQAERAANPPRPSKRKRVQAKRLAAAATDANGAGAPASVDGSSRPAVAVKGDPAKKGKTAKGASMGAATSAKGAARRHASPEELLAGRLHTSDKEALMKEFEDDGFGDLLGVLDMSDLFDDPGDGEGVDVGGDDSGVEDNEDELQAQETEAELALPEGQLSGRHKLAGIRGGRPDEDMLAARLRKSDKEALMKEFADDGFGDLLGVLDTSDLFKAGEEEDTDDHDDDDEGEDDGQGAEEQERLRRARERAAAEMYGQGMDEDEQVGSGAESGDHDSDEEQEQEQNGDTDDDDDRVGDQGTQDKSVAASAYVPPHLRGGSQPASAAAMAVGRSLRAQLNRLTERNVRGAASAIHSLYLHNAHAVVHDALCEGVLGLTCVKGMGLSPLSAAYAAVVVAISGKVGIDVMGRFLESLVPRYIRHVDAAESDEAANALMLLLNLYHLRAIHHDLLVDLAARHSGSFNEVDVEMLLLMLRRCGARIRSEDPVALKNITTSITSSARQWTTAHPPSSAASNTPTATSEPHTHRFKAPPASLQQMATAAAADRRAAEVDTGGGNDEDENGNAVRVKFMLDMITDLKNNRMRSQTNKDGIESLRKELRSMGRAATSDTAVRVHLDTLLSKKSRGRWWVVGDTRKTDVVAKVAAERNGSGGMSKLEVVAERLRINTDVRKSVFMAAMTASDTEDAVHRLLRLQLKGEQQREVVRVLVHCCVSEKTYNPFYIHVIARLCEAANSHKYTLQYTVWDKIKALRTKAVSEKQGGGVPVMTRQVRLIARMTADVITMKVLPLTVVRVLDMHALIDSERLMCQLLFARLFAQEDDLVNDILAHIEGATGTEMVCDGIGFFLQKYFLTDAAVRADQDMYRRAKHAQGVMDRRSMAIA